MSLTAPAGAPRVSPKERLGMLFEEFAELSGQRNAIDGRIVDVVAEIDHDGLCGMTGARSVTALVAWKLGIVLDDGEHHRHRQPTAHRDQPGTPP